MGYLGRLTHKREGNVHWSRHYGETPTSGSPAVERAGRCASGGAIALGNQVVRIVGSAGLGLAQCSPNGIVLDDAAHQHVGIQADRCLRLLALAMASSISASATGEAGFASMPLSSVTGDLTSVMRAPPSSNRKSIPSPSFKRSLQPPTRCDFLPVAPGRRAVVRLVILRT